MYHFSFSFFRPSQITMWDLQSGKLLRTIIDAHPLGSAVLHVMVCNERRFYLGKYYEGLLFEGCALAEPGGPWRLTFVLG